MPSAPCTTHARFEPSSISARASSSRQLRPRHADDLPRGARRIRQRTEQIERRANAQLAAASAPRASSTDGTSARRRTRCPRRAASARRSRGGAATLTPSASKTSALPHRLDTDRLPCLATVTPHAATTIAAADEMLNVPERSPPVPHVSNTSPGGVAQLHRVLAHRPREADDLRRPLAFHHERRQAAPPAPPGAARPSMTSRIAAAASSVVRSSWRTSFSMQLR